MLHIILDEQKTFDLIFNFVLSTIFRRLDWITEALRWIVFVE